MKEMTQIVMGKPWPYLSQLFVVVVLFFLGRDENVLINFRESLGTTALIIVCVCVVVVTVIF